MEGAIALLAAVVLLMASHYVLARVDARRRIDALKRRFDAASPARRRAVLFGLGFVAVYREAFEVVLFLRAIALDAGATMGAVLGGALTGGATCIVLVILLGRFGRRLAPAKLLTISGSLLCVLAVVLAGKGVHALQEAGVLTITPVAVPRLELLGVFPSIESVLGQVLVLGAFALIAGVSWARSSREATA